MMRDTTDLSSSLKRLPRIYFERWQIEVHHREEKDTLKVGQAQLWNVASVPKHRVLAIASYSAPTVGFATTLWRRRRSGLCRAAQVAPKRTTASCLDPIILLRKKMAQRPQLA